MTHQLKLFIVKIFLKFVGYLPARPKTIVFESFQGKQYSCNPKAIYEYMVEKHPDYKMYWSVDVKYIDNFSQENLKIIRRFSIKWLIVLAFAKYWIINGRMPTHLPKPKHTTYIQTWHGTPLKKLVFDMDEVHMPKTTTKQYKANFYKESRNWDYLLSPNEYSSKIFKRAFRFDKKIIESGYPRNDILYTGDNAEYINFLKKKLELPVDKKILLYAPTWRDNQFHEKGQYKFDLALDLSVLQKKYRDDFIILLRMHYLVAENFDLTLYKGFAYDFSQKADINELYLVSDLLITDYSSVFFDYANLRRPMIFYMYDIEEYRDVLRGFYIDIEKEAPGPIAKNMEELNVALDEFKSIQFSPYEEKYHTFLKRYCYLENGSSTERFLNEDIVKL